MGVGAWACKGDPQSSLDRGTTQAVVSDPQTIFVANGATVEVLVEARDNLNQATEITSVSAAAGAGVAAVRDFQYQPVFDANATTEEACNGIEHSEWTGAGCLVPRPNPTRIRYEVSGTAAGVSSLNVTLNGVSLDIPVTVTPLTVPITTSAAPAALGGASIVTITTDPATYAFDVNVPVHVDPDYGSFTGGNPLGYLNVGFAADGSNVQVVPAPGASGTMNIHGVLFLPVAGLSLTLPTATNVDGPASTFSGNCSSGTPQALAGPGPASGATDGYYDGWRCGTGFQYFTFVAGASGDHTITFEWDSDADMDMVISEYPVISTLCTAFTLSNPESCTATLTAGSTYRIRWDYYDGIEPTVGYTTITAP
jgi:hypothetical protein